MQTADTLPLLCQDERCDAHESLSIWVCWTRYILWFMSYMHDKSNTGSETQRGICFYASNITHIFSEDVRNVEKHLTKEHNIYIFSCMLEWVNNFLCVITICHPFVSNLYTGEIFSTCARSLAAMSRDLAHVLNVPAYKMKIEMMFIVSTCMEYTIGAINIHQEKKTKLYLLSEKYILCIHVGRPPTRKRCI